MGQFYSVVHMHVDSVSYIQIQTTITGDLMFLVSLQFCRKCFFSNDQFISIPLK